MFFKKRKAKEKKKREAGWVAQEKAFDGMISQASDIEDPAAKIISLKKISQDINNELVSEYFEITKKSLDKKFNTDVAIGGPALAAGLPMAFFSGPVGWVGFGLVSGGVIAGRLIGSKVGRSARKNLQQAASDHQARLTWQLFNISQLTQATIDNNVEEISKSPLYKEVLGLPGISKPFAEAAARHFADKAEQEAAAKLAAEETKPVEEAKPSVPKEAPNYDKLSGVLKSKPKQNKPQ